MLPAQVIQAATGTSGATLVACTSAPLSCSGSLATTRLDLLTCTVRVMGALKQIQVVLKEIRPPSGSRHDRQAHDPGHWAFWRREALAYASGLLPDSSTRLVAPKCLGITETGGGVRLYLPYLPHVPVDIKLAAAALGEWNARTLQDVAPRPRWLAGAAIAQRVHDTDRVGGLDWNSLPIAPASRARLIHLWDQRHDLNARLARLPRVLAHGDYHLGNLIAAQGHTYVLDWATLGQEALGADLAMLALNLELPPADEIFSSYRAELAKIAAPELCALAEFGYRASAVIAGVSRLHWRLSRGQCLDTAEAWIDWFTAAKI